MILVLQGVRKICKINARPFKDLGIGFEKSVLVLILLKQFGLSLAFSFDLDLRLDVSVLVEMFNEKTIASVGAAHLQLRLMYKVLKTFCALSHYYVDLC